MQKMAKFEINGFPLILKFYNGRGDLPPPPRPWRNSDSPVQLGLTFVIVFFVKSLANKNCVFYASSHKTSCSCIIKNLLGLAKQLKLHRVVVRWLVTGDWCPVRHDTLNIFFFKDFIVILLLFAYVNILQFLRTFNVMHWICVQFT